MCNQVRSSRSSDLVSRLRSIGTRPVDVDGLISGPARCRRPPGYHPVRRRPRPRPDAETPPRQLPIGHGSGRSTKAAFSGKYGVREAECGAGGERWRSLTPLLFVFRHCCARRRRGGAESEYLSGRRAAGARAIGRHRGSLLRRRSNIGEQAAAPPCLLPDQRKPITSGISQKRSENIFETVERR